MNLRPEIKLYGAKRCHKTNFYMDFFDANRLSYRLLDVEENKAYANELRRLYDNRKLNFPTITIGNKKLRNPKVEELEKWVNILKSKKNESNLE